MKKFVLGFLSACLLLSAISVLAENFEAVTASFPILINGKEFKTDKPIVTINGSTYLPLRAVGDALGVKVNWNQQENRVEIGDAPTETADYSRTNPAPLNTVQKINVNNFMQEYSAAVRVVETTRGDAAWKMVKEANMFNSSADDDYEYIVAKIAVSVLSVKDDKAVNISGMSFECFSGNNEKYNTKMVVPPKPELSTQLYAGGNTEGYAVFHVKKSDASPKIVYGLNYDGSGGIWFNLQ